MRRSSIAARSAMWLLLDTWPSAACGRVNGVKDHENSPGVITVFPHL